MSNKNSAGNQDNIRVIKGDSVSSRVMQSLLVHLGLSSILAFILWVMAPTIIRSKLAPDFLITAVSNEVDPQSYLFGVAIFVAVIIGFVSWVFRAKVISKANFDYVIDIGQGTFEFPTSGLGRESVALESIENVYLDTNKSKGSDGKTKTNYHLNLTGTFGARSLKPPSKIARDELRGALKEAMKKQRK